MAEPLATASEAMCGELWPLLRPGCPPLGLGCRAKKATTEAPQKEGTFRVHMLRISQYLLPRGQCLGGTIPALQLRVQKGCATELG